MSTDGILFEIASLPDQFGGGVQCFLSAGTSGDCNGNGVPDECDIANSTSEDCNGNGIPDECEMDCNNNNVPDDCDVDPSDPDGNGLVSPDCNINGIPDECEPDCQPNGVADDCDIANGTSRDWNYDGIPDECQILGAAIYVDENASLSPHDGSDWDHAYLTLQEGLADARANPEKLFILVADGVYEPDDGTGQPGNRSLSFDLVNGVAMLGGFAGYGAADPFERKPQAIEPVGHATVLSGDLLENDQPGFVNNADNSYHVVTAGSTVTRSTILDGFFIVGGNADGYEGGGGLRIIEGNPRVFNCTITANSALYNGGGIAVENGSPELSNLIVARNRTTNTYGYGTGSGVYCDGMSQPSIVNSTVVWNSSWNSGGLVADHAVLTNSILWGNEPEQIKSAYGSLAVSYCTVQGGWPGTRILRSDPAFIDADGPDDNPDTWQDNDYHLSSVSPCIDVGANGVSRRPLQDIDLQNRVQECVVDMGADESPHFRDCNNNGHPDGCDVLADPSIDCNNNGRPDTCDIADGISSDCDQSGVPDECEVGVHAWADFDGDCDVDQSDFNHAQECWTGGLISLDCQDVCVTLKDPEEEIVGLGDLVLLERCASGPGIPADPSCGDCDLDGVPDGLDSGPPCNIPGDQDCDGVEVRGRGICASGQTTGCDDNCPGAANAQCDQQQPNYDCQTDSDGDGIGDACDPTPNGPPPPVPPVTIQVLAWRSMREHGTGNWLGVTLDPALTADSATVEPRQGSVQVIEADLSDAAGASSDLESVLVFDDEFNFITPNDVYLDSGDTRVVITFIDDPMVDDDFLLDQKCYLIDLSPAIVDTEGDPPIGDADCAIRMLAADADGNATVEQADVSDIAAANGQTAGSSNVRLDVNVDGVINATDESIASSLLNNTVTCSGGMMMMGMGGGVGLAGGADALVGTSQAPNLLTLLRQAAIALPPSANVSAQWVVHGTGATLVALPAGGGTISVDLVVTTDAPIWGLEGKPAVDAANVVSINSADWTELDNVLFSHDVDGHNQSSYYDLTVMDWLWVRLTPDGTDVTAWGMDVDSLLGVDPPTVWTLTQDLTAVNGPIAAPTAEPAIEAQDSAQWFTTTAFLGGVTREPLPAGQTVLATLSLTISAQPGTYHLTLTDPQFTDTTHVTFPATTGQPLEIVVGQ